MALLFHHICGSAITLRDDRYHAERRHDSFCHGLVFSDRPIPPRTEVSLELVHTTGPRLGRARFGFTTCEPTAFLRGGVPHFAIPHLEKLGETWVKPLSRKHCNNGSRLSFCLDEEGRVHLSVNGIKRGVFVSGVNRSRPVWFVVDLYGNATGVKLLKEDSGVPPEILIRGRETLQLYRSACAESGTQPLHRTRLMLVGQDGTGKTSLRRNLISDSKEEAADNVDELSAACSFNLRDPTVWRSALQKPRLSLTLTSIPDLKADLRALSSTFDTAAESFLPELEDNVDDDDVFTSDDVTDDASGDVIASENLVLEVLHHFARQATKREDLEEKNLLTSIISSTDLNESNVCHELVKDCSEQVADLVRARFASLQSSIHQQNGGGQEVQMDIWDFSGKSIFYSTQQVFLTSRAVYVIVFDLRYGLNDPAKHVSSDTIESCDEDVSELTNLEWIHFWLRSIHAHAARNSSDLVHNQSLSPPVFIVGTHREDVNDDDVARDKQILETFRILLTSLVGRPYKNHVVERFYAVENCLELGNDEQIDVLRSDIQRVSGGEVYMGEHLPTRWVTFERSLAQLITQGTYYTSVDQIREVARECEICSSDELQAMLEFYNDLGMIIYYGGQFLVDGTFRSTVILRPQWLVNMFRRVITANANDPSIGAVITKTLDANGVLDDQVIAHVFSDVISQKPALIGLMEKFDQICARLPPLSVIEHDALIETSYYVPSRVKRRTNQSSSFTPAANDVIFYVDFNGFLPEGLFHRIVTRAIRWCQDQGGRDVRLRYRLARLYLDREHDFVLEMSSLKYARIKVIVVRVAQPDDSELTSIESTLNRALPPPKPEACARVRYFLESVLASLRTLWIHRLTYRVCVLCQCDRRCSVHQLQKCPSSPCLHFLNLDECLTHKVSLLYVVNIDEFRLKCTGVGSLPTQQCIRGFSVISSQGSTGPVLPESILAPSNDSIISDIEQQQGATLPAWVRTSAKLLNGGNEGQDWMALAKRLGYKKSKISRLNDDLNPGLSLMVDWIVSSGNTPLSVDLIVSCLDQMGKTDIVDVIEKGRDTEIRPCTVFISYEWNIQDEVGLLRDRLERQGYSCWMDLGQMGGGDQLNAKIDEGIRHCKVVVACVTMRYIVSHVCNRELSLADVLRKPIIPVMYEKVPWPPPGGMALIFSQLVYVDMKGVGGHGGSGIHADTESRYQEILNLVHRNAKPEQKRTGIALPPFKENAPPLPEKRGSGTSTLGSRTSSSSSIHIEPINHGYLVRRQSLRSEDGTIQVERVHVSKCAICTLL